VRRRPKRLLPALAVTIVACAIAAGPAAGEDPQPPTIMTASGETLPILLPRGKPVPVGLGIGFTSEDVTTHTAPEISRIAFDVSRNVLFDFEGLPRCTLPELFKSYGGEEPCPRSLVGTGTVISEITVPGQPTARAAEGALYAYYGSVRGRPYILARVAVEKPLPLIYVIPFAIKPEEGDFGTSLVANKMHLLHGICARGRPDCFSHPYDFKGIYGHISKFRLFLSGRVRTGGTRRSLVSASCPLHGRAPAYPLEQVTLRYAFGGELSVPTMGRCKA
jgi:hypothetical protein